jgi:hypothetical protein
MVIPPMLHELAGVMTMGVGDGTGTAALCPAHPPSRPPANASRVPARITRIISSPFWCSFAFAFRLSVSAENQSLDLVTV